MTCAEDSGGVGYADPGDHESREWFHERVRLAMRDAEAFYRREVADRNAYIERRERHVIQLARIVAARQGDPKPGAPVAVIGHAPGSSCELVVCGVCGDESDEGDAQWDVSLNGVWDAACRVCLPGQVGRGDVLLDRASAHEMLGQFGGGASS